MVYRGQVALQTTSPWDGSLLYPAEPIALPSSRCEYADCRKPRKRRQRFPDPTGSMTCRPPIVELVSSYLGKENGHTGRKSSLAVLSHRALAVFPLHETWARGAGSWRDLLAIRVFAAAFLPSWANSPRPITHQPQASAGRRGRGQTEYAYLHLGTWTFGRSESRRRDMKPSTLVLSRPAAPPGRKLSQFFFIIGNMTIIICYGPCLRLMANGKRCQGYRP